jgi:hypothetical protein
MTVRGESQPLSALVKSVTLWLCPERSQRQRHHLVRK